MIDNLIVTGLTATYQPLPLRHRFVLSIRESDHASLIRWKLVMSDGSQYLGESVPVQYVTGETVESVLALQSELRAAVLWRSPLEAAILGRELTLRFPNAPAARAGVEIALMNAWSKISGITLFDHFGGKLEHIESDITISKVENSLVIAKGYYDEGYRIFKTKVGGSDTESDLARLIELDRGLPDSRFRLDANQGFQPEQALRFLDAVLQQNIRIELLEQPVPKEDIAGLDFVASHSSVPIIADEACRTAYDAERLFRETNVHGVNVKVMKSGLFGAQEIMRVALRAKKKLMIGCMIESPVGLSISVALACGSGAFDYCDLDGHDLIALEHPIEGFEAKGPILRSRV